MFSRVESSSISQQDRKMEWAEPFEVSKDISQRLKAVNTSYFFRPDGALKKELEEINPADLTHALHHFFIDMVNENGVTDPVQFLDRLTTLIPFTKLQEVVQDDIGEALQTAKEMFEEAKLYLQLAQGNRSSNSRTRLSSILEGLISVIESIVTAFGIGDFFKPAQSNIHADFKSQKIMTLLGLFSMVSTILIPASGAATGGLIIGGTLLAIAALSVIWPFIKPTPNYLSSAKNWTKQVQNGITEEAYGRKESLDQIANIIKRDRHAILLGPSRIGKSLTAQAFAEAIERGDYPELRGKVVFRINTADIVGQQASFLGGASSILDDISTQMGRHRNDIILVFDEVHMACKDKIADQLKTFLDKGGEFPHAIAITTEEEYDKYVKENSAFSKRFDKVHIRNTSQDETLKILGDIVLKSRSESFFDEGILNYIYTKSCAVKDAPQPISALKLLERCITRIERTQLSSVEKRIIEVSSKVLSLREEVLLTHNFKKQKNLRKEIAELEKQMVELQEALRKEQGTLKQLFRQKDLLDRVGKEMYSSVLKISSIAQQTINSKNEKQVKLFLLLHMLRQSLQGHVAKQAAKFGLFIDKQLIDKMATE